MPRIKYRTCVLYLPPSKQLNPGELFHAWRSVDQICLLCLSYLVVISLVYSMIFFAANTLQISFPTAGHKYIPPCGMAKYLNVEVIPFGKMVGKSFAEIIYN